MNKLICLGLVLALTSTGTLAEPGNGRLFQQRSMGGIEPPHALRDGRHLAMPGGELGLRGGMGRVFKRVDANGDQLISLEEFLAHPLSRVDHRFDRLDDDADGAVSREEFDSRRSDPPRGGWVDREALRACMALQLGEELPSPPDPDAMFDALDANDDGAVTEAELTASLTERLTARFNRIDTNADGSLTQAELMDSMKAMRERREVRRQCFEEQRDLADIYAE